MVKRSKAETEKFYRALVAEQERSELSVRAFAAQRGIAAGTLSSWRHELKQRDAARAAKEKKSSPSFVPVSVAAAPEPPKKTAAVYEIVLGGDRVLRVPADFDVARVAELVNAVASC